MLYGIRHNGDIPMLNGKSKSRARDSGIPETAPGNA